MRTAALRAERPGPRSQLRQLVAGLVALPLTAVPFIGYANLTPEGRLVRDRAMVALNPPSLPTLSPEQKAAAAAAAPRYRGAVMALAYHGIGSASDGEGGFVVSPKRFAEHLATLQAAGMRTVTAAQVADAFAGGAPLPPNAVLITFDDGRADAMMFADPLLQEAGMAATMFVITGAAAKPGVYYASWDRLRAYARSGRWDIQSHTANSHREHKVPGGGSLPKLTSRTQGESLAGYQARVREDLAEATAAIHTHTGRRPVAFAYPFGAYGADRTNDREIAAVLRQEVARQYAIAFQQDDQETVPLLTRDQDALLLRRVEVENWSGLQLLERIDRARRWTSSAAGVPAAPPAGQSAAGGRTPGTPGASQQSPPGAGDPSPAPASPLSLPERGGPLVSVPDLPGVELPPVTVTLPPVTLPPADVRLPPATLPPANSPPLPVGTSPPNPSPPATSPPTTRPLATSPPNTSPPTTSPPATTPPTTACKPAGKSGRCAGKG